MMERRPTGPGPRLADEVVALLQERILSGALPPGHRLRQASLAAEFNVSRTPLREALGRLEEQGLVANSPTQGLQVIAPDSRRLLEAYELREVLDGLSARLAAKRHGPALVRSLLRALEVQRIALHPWNSRLWTEGNVSFHEAVTEAAANEYLVRLLPVMRLTAQMFYPRMLLNRERTEDAHREHMAIANAIRRRDDEEAESLARLHIQTTVEMLRQRVSSHPELVERKEATDENDEAASDRHDRRPVE